MNKLRPICYLVLFFFTFSCGNSENIDETVSVDLSELVKVEGGKYNGGILKLNSVEDYTSLFPAASNDVYSTHIASQGYEGLLRLNQKTLEVEPCIAESFAISKNKRVYTFSLREGVSFVDDDCFKKGKGRAVNAADFKYCFEFLCSNHPENKWSSLFRGKVLGATEYGNGSAKEVVGIRVIDNTTLEIELVNPYSGFPNLLAINASTVYPKEAIDKYGYEGMNDRIIGSGPFVAKNIENGKNVTFVKNKNYWRKDEFGNQLPFLNQLEISFIKDKNEELEAFQDEELDFVWGIPVEEIQNIMGTLQDAKDGKNKEFNLQSINSLNIVYFGFLNTGEVFSDVRIRKAFNYAVDRDSLSDFILQGEGVAAHNGFVPEMKGYPSESVDGFDYNPELAKKLMAEAGYPNGEGFPEITLNLNASGGINEKVVGVLTRMINYNLGTNIKMQVMPMSELHPMVERGQIDFWRFGWLADYPDPSNFLYLFHGKNIIESQETSINYFRYSNPAFDQVYEAALLEINYEKRMELYARADQILMNDAVIMPLYFNVGIRLIDPDIRDFDINEMEYRDLAVVYYKVTKKEKIRVYDSLIDEENLVE